MTMTLKWGFVNEFDLVFVAVYQHFLNIAYIDALINEVKNVFVSMFRDRLLVLDGQPYDFDNEFARIVRQFELKEQHVGTLGMVLHGCHSLIRTKWRVKRNTQSL